MQRVGRRPRALVLEFDVANGRTITIIAEQTPGAVYGFDSFRVPRILVRRIPAGHLCASPAPAVPSNITLVKGWFDNMLPGFLAGQPDRVSFRHVDCDLYPSGVLCPDAVTGSHRARNRDHVRRVLQVSGVAVLV